MGSPEKDRLALFGNGPRQKCGSNQSREHGRGEEHPGCVPGSGAGELEKRVRQVVAKEPACKRDRVILRKSSQSIAGKL